jgi:hypothetical protein
VSIEQLNNSGASEDERRRCEAHHIIDILEDVGMNFREEGRLMSGRCEAHHISLRKLYVLCAMGRWNR